MAETEAEKKGDAPNSGLNISPTIDIKQKIIDGSEKIEFSSREDETPASDQIKIEEVVKPDQQDELEKPEDEPTEEQVKGLLDPIKNEIIEQAAIALTPNNEEEKPKEEEQKSPTALSGILQKPAQQIVEKQENHTEEKQPEEEPKPENEDQSDNEMLQINIDDKIKEIPKQINEEMAAEKSKDETDEKKDDLSFFNDTFQTETKKVTEASNQSESEASEPVESEQPPPREEQKTQKTAKREEIHFDSKPKRKRAKSVFGDEPMPYTENDLEMAYNAFVKKNELPPFLMRDYVIDYARVHALKAAIAENYDEAARREKIVDNIVAAFNNDQGQFDTDTKLGSLEHRLQFARDQKQKIHSKYLQQIEDLKTNEKKRMEQLVAYHNQEIEDFQADCQTPDFLLKFSKPSLKLLQLRKQQKNLALAHDFDGAKSIKSTADRLQAAETAAARDRAADSVKLKYKDIVERHERAIKCQRLNSQRKITEKETQMKCELDSYDKLIKQLLDKIREAKNGKVTTLPSLSTGRPIPLSANKKISQFRRSSAKAKLDVKLGNINKILGLYVK
ncbi:hypothetical protein TVAG_460680 [Trichomonas vaginalis G3]|uniref:Uncharacterized protein n=1 Tax=Trichomonas vaginalis (strain ATCC PRA-98 / G3) TaxID=412133 RepID=A2DY42_TRIV3|nr:hypothetical protein TVAGG3_0644440 [Trichomonas vaginalis G3]EAY14651.1 hypothetical protein TVAG_460680 [Trichomonas vaginalis G3]KAI5505401.1 hypothetical protein TVAGG3_0644440 [Trichomonas vaginalis G3]|eukprot:XP_001326874.1 hypothetical protein [Trichomonas vaginalis G3]